MGRLGSGMRVSARFQLRQIALYTLARGGSVVVLGSEKCPTPRKMGG